MGRDWYTKDYHAIIYSLYDIAIIFRDIIDSFKIIGSAEAIATKLNFQEELFSLEQKGVALPNQTNIFEPPNFVACQYDYYDNRKPDIACVDYGLLTYIAEIKNNLDIATGIVSTFIGFNMQKHDD